MDGRTDGWLDGRTEVRLQGPYLQAGLGDGVVSVLVDDALGPTLELLDGIIRPPLLQVALLIVLATCPHTAHVPHVTHGNSDTTSSTDLKITG